MAPLPGYLDNVRIPRLDDVEKVMLDEPLVIEEIIEAIKMLKNGKCSGTDGERGGDRFRHNYI